MNGNPNTDAAYKDTLVQLAADLTRRYASVRSLTPQQSAAYFRETLAGLMGDADTQVKETRPHMKDGTASKALVPAVPIEESVTPDYIVCLEDGKKFKMLKRHLRASYGLTPEQYRKKWGLPGNYPMVAENYSKKRSQYAKAFGLGTYDRERGGNVRRFSVAS